jgi:hypothetical protein
MSPRPSGSSRRASISASATDGELDLDEQEVVLAFLDVGANAAEQMVEVLTLRRRGAGLLAGLALGVGGAGTLDEQRAGDAAADEDQEPEQRVQVLQPLALGIEPGPKARRRRAGIPQHPPERAEQRPEEQGAGVRGGHGSEA